MADEVDRVERAQAESEHLDGERRSLAAVSAAYDCICADAETIRDAPPGATKALLIDAFSNRLSAFQLLLAAFEPLATVLSETYGRAALQQQIVRLGAQAAWSSRAARIAADVERIFAETTGVEQTSAVFQALERRLTDLEESAAALERDGHPGSRERLDEVLSGVRARIKALEDPALREMEAARWAMFTRLVPAAELQPFSAPQPAQPQPAQQRAPQPQAADPDETAKLRAIQQAIDADNRATTMKIFEIQRKAQEDAFTSMQAIHDKQNEMNL
jgi:hypothetical protein